MGVTGNDEPVLIDLDVALAPVSPDGPDRPLWNPSRRRAVMGAAVIVAASVLAADTARGTDPAVSVPFVVSRPVTVSATGAPVAVIGDSLYTTADDGSRLSAYSLRTGRRRWTSSIPKTTQPGLIDAGPYLLISPQTGSTFAVEARTGVVLWQHRGTPVWLAPAGDRVALATWEPPADQTDPGRSTLAVVTVGNGANSAVFAPAVGADAVWDVSSPDIGVRWMAGMFVREDADGGMLFDFASARARRLDLPLPAPPADYGAGDRPFYETLLISRDLVLDTSGWGGRNLLTGYAGNPLRSRWTAPDRMLLGAWRCGAALCGSDVNEAMAVDPGTGDVRWRSPGGLLWRASGHRVYSSARVGRDQGTGIAVLDETTGRELLRQDSWRPVTSTIDGARIPILAYSAGGQALAVLDAQRLTTYRLTLLPHAGADCWTSRTYVACRTRTDTFRAWRYSA
jgi:outer membrane protein assembly factor BamB